MSQSVPPIEEDFIHTPDPAEPLWTESFGHWFYSCENDIGLFLHLQRSHSNPELWRELLTIKCSDGTALVGKSWGLNRDPKNPGANALNIRCLEPYQSWKVSFDGALRRLNIEDLMGDVFKDGLWEPARLKLDCRAHTPVWADASKGEWAKAHLEQALRFEGKLQFGEQTFELRGLGLRDHSYGVRNSAKSGNALWFNGQFASGRSFFVVRHTTADGQTYDVARVVDNGKIVEGQIEEISPQEHPEPGSGIHIRLSSPLGDYEIRGEFVYRLPVSFPGPSEQVPGKSPQQNNLFYYDSCLRYTMNDEKGTGFANIVFAPEG